MGSDRPGECEEQLSQVFLCSESCSKSQQICTLTPFSLAQQRQAAIALGGRPHLSICSGPWLLQGPELWDRRICLACLAWQSHAQVHGEPLRHLVWNFPPGA